MRFNLHFKTRQYTKIYIYWLVAILVLFAVYPSEAQPVRVWDKTLGGDRGDVLRSVVPSSDGGYLAGGYSYSSKVGDKSQYSNGGLDYWVIKVNGQGEKQWDQTLGAFGNDDLTSIIATVDGGFLLGGTSTYPEEVADVNGSSKGSGDYWIVKINANGTRQWRQNLGGKGVDRLRSMVVTSDGGFLLGGTSTSSAEIDKTAPNLGEEDYWIVKIDANGQKLWDRTFGGAKSDILKSMVATSDGGFLIGGESFSNASLTKAQNAKGLSDFWVIRLDANGQKLWDRTLGGVATEQLNSITLTATGEFLLGGHSNSTAGEDKTEASKGLFDFWVVKLDANGQKLWDRTLGGVATEQLNSVVAVTDGGYLLGGQSNSLAGGDKTGGTKGSYDFWLVKLDAHGQKQWDQTFGSNSVDNLISIVANTDGTILLGGHSNGNASFDKTQNSRGAEDYWLLKVKACTPPVVNLNVSTYELTCTTPSATLAVEAGNNTGPLTYKWNTGATTSSIAVTQAGRYSVIVTNENGCQTISSEVVISSNKAAFGSTLVSTGVIDCLQPTVNLEATPGPLVGRKYTFSSGAIQQGDVFSNQATVSQPGIYSVVVTNPNGCTSTASATVEGSSALPAAPVLSASSLTTNNQPISVTATGCSGQLNWTVQPGTGMAYGSVYTLSTPGQYTLSATCTTNNCISPPASLTLNIRSEQSPLTFVAPTYNCLTGLITFNTYGGNGSLIEYAAIGITRWSSTRTHTVEAGLRQDPKVIILQARQSGVVIEYSFDLPTACSGPTPTNTLPQPPVPPILLAPFAAQVGAPFSGTLAAFTDRETPYNLSYGITGLPAGLSFESSTRIISGRPTQAGSFLLTYQATDADGGRNSINYVLTVNPAETSTVTGNFDGYLDKVECGTIRGWVWDSDKPNTPLTVEFFTGDVVWGSAVANIYREDIKAAGKGNGEHVYNFVTPNSLKDGRPHAISARVLGSTYLLKWGPKILTCPAQSRLATDGVDTKPLFDAILLGNPVSKDKIYVEIKGAQGLPVTLSLIDLQGRLINQNQIKVIERAERHQLTIGQESSGMLLLRVSTPTLTKMLKVLIEN